MPPLQLLMYDGLGNEIRQCMPEQYGNPAVQTQNPAAVQDLILGAVNIAGEVTAQQAGSGSGLWDGVLSIKLQRPDGDAHGGGGVVIGGGADCQDGLEEVGITWRTVRSHGVQ
jgi:hypothetical protein